VNGSSTWHMSAMQVELLKFPRFGGELWAHGAR
jgi:hypothetical protein